MRRSKTPDTSGEDLAKIDLLVLYKTAKELYNNACQQQSSISQDDEGETANRETILDYIRLAKLMYEECIPAK